MIYAVLSIFILLTLFFAWTTYNLFRQNQQLESYIKDFNKVEDDVEKFYRVILGLLTQTYAELQRIDKRGSFSSDDEVGFAFRVIIKAIESCKKAIENIQQTEETKGH